MEQKNEAIASLTALERVRMLVESGEADKTIRAFG
jgi:hypothetical protein